MIDEAPRFGIVPEHQEPEWELQSGELALPAVDLRAVAAADPPYGQVVRSRRSHRDYSVQARTRSGPSRAILRASTGCAHGGPQSMLLRGPVRVAASFSGASRHDEGPHFREGLQ